MKEQLKNITSNLGSIALLTGAACASYMVGGPLVQSVVGGIFTNISSSLIENFEYKKIKELLTKIKPSELNHDVEKLLTKALVWTFNNIEILYSEHLKTKEQKNTLKKITEKLITQINSHEEKGFLKSKQVIALLDELDSNEFLLDDLLTHPELPIIDEANPFPTFLKEKFLTNLQLCFGELLKKPENNRALIAYTRNILQGIQKNTHLAFLQNDLILQQQAELKNALISFQNSIESDKINIDEYLKEISNLLDLHINPLAKEINLLAQYANDIKQDTQIIKDISVETQIRVEQIQEYIEKTTHLNSLVKGIVTFQNSGDKPAIGLKVNGFGAPSVLTDEFGYFELNFADKKQGEKVKILFGRSTPYDTCIEVVNNKVLEVTRIPDNPNDLLEVFICACGQKDENALRYYGILSQSVEEKYSKTFEEIEKKLLVPNLQEDKVRELQNQKSELEQKLSEIQKKLEEQAQFISSINLDKASSLVKDAIQSIEVGNEVESALFILDDDKLNAAYLNALEKKTKAEKEIEQVIEGYTLKINLLLSKFDYKNCIYAYDKLIQIFETNNLNKKELSEKYYEYAKVLDHYGSYHDAINFYNKCIHIVDEITSKSNGESNNVFTVDDIELSDKRTASKMSIFSIRKYVLNDENLNEDTVSKIYMPLLESLNRRDDNIDLKELMPFFQYLSLMEKYENDDTITEEQEEKLLNDFQAEYFRLIEKGTLKKNEDFYIFKIARIEDIEEKIKVLIEGIEELSKDLDKNYERVARLYHEISRQYKYEKSFELALEYNLKEFDIWEKYLPALSPQLAIELKNLSYSYSFNNNIIKAIETVKKAISIQEQILNSDNIDLAYSYEALGNHFDYNEEYAESIKCLLKALEIYVKIFGDKEYNMRYIFSSLARTCNKCDDFDNAIFYAEKVRKVDPENAEWSGDWIIYESAKKRGKQKLDNFDFKGAKEDFTIMSKFDFDKPFHFRMASEEEKTTSKSLIQIADILADIDILNRNRNVTYLEIFELYRIVAKKFNETSGFDDDALNFHYQALNLINEYDPANMPYKVEQLINLGETLRSQGKKEEAIDQIEKAIRVIKLAYDEDCIELCQPYDVFYQWECSDKNFEKAIEWKLQILEIIENKYGMYNRRIYKNLNHIAVTYELDMEEYEKSYPIRALLVQISHHADFDDETLQSVAKRNHKFTAFELGKKYFEDKNYLMAAVVFLDSYYMDTNDLSTNEYNDICYPELKKKYGMPISERDFDEVAAYHRYPFFPALIALGQIEQETIGNVKDFLKLNEGIYPEHKASYYCWAVFYAVNNEKELALQNIRLALEKGYDNIDWLRIDKNLDNIRNEPEFKEMLIA